MVILYSNLTNYLPSSSTLTKITVSVSKEYRSSIVAVIIMSKFGLIISQLFKYNKVGDGELKGQN